MKLDPESRLPATMVRIPGFTLEGVNYADYFMDRYEVTNREYKAFVDAGGYGNRTYWTDPFLKGGTEIAWDDAMALFKDETGRPGPRTWRVGTYPDGQADHPVGGVSWYEAAAYARFAGKELPTTSHWAQAQRFYREDSWIIVPRSNFGGSGPRPVGKPGALNAFGLLRHRRKRPGVVLQRSRLRPRHARRGVDGRYIPCRMDHPEGPIRSRRHAWIPPGADVRRCRRRSDGCDNRSRRPRCGTIARKSPLRSPNSRIFGGSYGYEKVPAQCRGGGDRRLRALGSCKGRLRSSVRQRARRRVPLSSQECATASPDRDLLAARRFHHASSQSTMSS